MSLSFSWSGLVFSSPSRSPSCLLSMRLNFLLHVHLSIGTRRYVYSIAFSSLLVPPIAFGAWPPLKTKPGVPRPSHEATLRIRSSIIGSVRAWTVIFCQRPREPNQKTSSRKHFLKSKPRTHQKNADPSAAPLPPLSPGTEYSLEPSEPSTTALNGRSGSPLWRLLQVVKGCAANAPPEISEAAAVNRGAAALGLPLRRPGQGRTITITIPLGRRERRVL